MNWAYCSPVGAGDGNRTRDPLLGRQMLYQLSYTDVYGQGFHAKKPQHFPSFRAVRNRKRRTRSPGRLPGGAAERI